MIAKHHQEEIRELAYMLGHRKGDDLEAAMLSLPAYIQHIADHVTGEEREELLRVADIKDPAIAGALLKRIIPSAEAGSCRIYHVTTMSGEKYYYDMKFRPEEDVLADYAADPFSFEDGSYRIMDPAYARAVIRSSALDLVMDIHPQENILSISTDGLNYRYERLSDHLSDHPGGSGHPEEQRPRLFIDMDGTLAVFQKVDTLETLYEEGYFRNLPPIANVVEAVRIFISENPDTDVYIMSSVLSDSKYALAEKNAWLDQYLPEIDSEHRIFPTCGDNKLDFVPDGIRPDDHLLDDYTHNLTLWEPPAKGIKLLNGINHTHGTWKGNRIGYDRSPEEISAGIAAIMSGTPIVESLKPVRTQTGPKL